MKINVVLFASLCLLLLNGAHVDARRHPGRSRNYRLFVFGDSFVDTGATSHSSHQWYTPYGMSDSAHGHRPTGRFSDGLVQSDFLARILGGDESPPAYRVWVDEDDDGGQFTGINFSVAGSSVSNGNGSDVATSLGDQIDQFGDLVSAGDIDREDLEDSVALVAVSGINDYKSLYDYSSDADLRSFTNGVANKILVGVRKLQRLGVSKVLVDSVPPFGCTPWRTWNNNYRSCDAHSNDISSMHNAALRRKLDRLDDVLVLDLEGIFNRIFSSGTDLSRRFPSRFTPCCDSPDPEKNYCGQVDDRGTKMYTLCRNPANYLYFDMLHPTQASWNVVMDALKDPIKDFLGI